MMSRPTPPILDYRSPRPGAPPCDELVDVYAPALLIVPPILIAGCIYVFWAIFDYSTSADPFSHAAFLLAWVVFIGSITYGLSLRRLR
jgi:hypothetical protein